MSDLNIRTLIETLMMPEARRRLKAETQHQRTHIEDLSDTGYELSEEHLYLVTGGTRHEGGGSAGSCTQAGLCDAE